MKKSALFLGAILVSLILASCGPENSLFPLFTKEDQVFDEQLLGEWRLRGDEKAGPEDSRLIFRRGKEKATYEVLWTGPEQETQGGFVLFAHLVRLGNSLFIDFGTPDPEKMADSGKAKFGEYPFPIIECHMFGRIVIDKKSAQIDLLADIWVENQAHAGELALATVKTPDGTVIAATTEELRKFALEHAEDTEAFSNKEYLYRSK